MLIYPAMDLYGSSVVGLYRGNYDEMKVYASNPMDIVSDLVYQGATHLHLVDMASARTGRVETELVKKIKENTRLFIEVGGSIRNIPSIDRYLEAGADRVVIGASALQNEAFVKEAIQKYTDRVVISVDIKDGMVSVQGRTERNAPKAIDYALKLQDYGARTLICTDVSNAGEMKGIDSQLYQELVDRLDVDIIASGGVTSLEDILELLTMKMYGVIIGRAYYDGAIYIREAIRLAGK